MKTLLAVLLVLLSGCATVAPVDDPRAARLEYVRESLQAQLDANGDKDTVRIEDTGKDINVGEGDGPLVIVKLPKHGRECLMALHPTNKDLFAVVGCDDVPPVTEQ